MQIRLAHLCCLFACLITSSLHAEDWPQWRGENRDGVWNEEGIVDELPAGQLPVVWSVPVNPGYSGPTVSNGRVFLTDRKQDRSQTERIFCLDASDGSLIWEHEYTSVYEIGYTAGPRASVTVDGDLAFAVGAMGHFHCLNAATGEVLWQRDLNEEYDIRMPAWGIAAPPLVYHDLVIQQVGGAGEACMVAFDKQSGKEAWRALEERAGYAAPILIQQNKTDVLVCWTGESLSGLSPKTGKVLWAHSMPPIKMPIGITTPVYDGKTIFVSSFYDGSLMVTAPQDELKSELVWRARGRDEQKTGSPTAQTPNGEISDGTYGVHTMIGTPIVMNGIIYAVDSYGEFRGLEAATGKRLWEDLTAVRRARWATIHMVRRGPQTWMLNQHGELMIARLSPTGLEITSRSQLIAPTRVQLNRRGGVVWSHPAFAEKSIFARSDTQLIRVSLAK